MSHGQPPRWPPPQQAPLYPPSPAPGAPWNGTYPPPWAPYGVEPRTGLPYSDKQRLVAGLLQIFVGGFAIGRFYTGHVGLAIAQLCVVWFTCGMGALWPFIDGILLLANGGTDSEGRPLRD